MKILIISNKNEGGGAEKVATDTFTLLSKMYDVKFVTCESDGMEDAKVNALSFIFSFRNFNAMKSVLAEFKPDIIHLHNHLPHLSPSVLAAIKQYSSQTAMSVPIFQTAHDYHPVCPNSSLFSDSADSICKRCLGSGGEHILFQKCDSRGHLVGLLKYIRFKINKFFSKSVGVKYIAPSHFMREILSSKYTNVSFIRNPNEFQLMVEEKNLDQNDIIYFGRISKEKNISLLVDAFNQLINEGAKVGNLKIVGDGPEIEPLKYKVDILGLQGRVLFTGRLNGSELINEMSSCLISVLPSKWYENAPLVIAESIINGVYPVTSNIGGMVELIDAYGCGATFNNDDVNSLVSTIKEIYSYDKLELDKSQVILMHCDEGYLDGLVKVFKG